MNNLQRTNLRNALKHAQSYFNPPAIAKHDRDIHLESVKYNIAGASGILSIAECEAIKSGDDALAMRIGEIRHLLTKLA